MTRENAEKVNDLLEELNELEKIKDVFNGKYPVAHFAVKTHYGTDSIYYVLNRKYNERGLALIETFIKELEEELSKL